MIKLVQLILHYNLIVTLIKLIVLIILDKKIKRLDNYVMYTASNNCKSWLNYHKKLPACL